METKKNLPTVEVVQTIDSLKIKFDGLPFLCIRRNELISFQSWKEQGDRYIIEFYTKERDILTEYDNAELWKQVLQHLDKGYIF